jgi:hypothetical protein
MKKKIRIVIFSVGALFFLFNFSRVFSYSTHYTHPDLTEEIAKAFNNINKNNERVIDEQEIQWMRHGATEEDEPARWTNHFYDPTTGKGWTGSRFGYLTPEQGLATVADIAAREPISSVDWVTNQDYQAAYGRQFGNQTWQKAVKSYVDGDKKSAFIALGHVLHLVEDASVPDHTRDDTHADLFGDPGSPYEKYSADFTNFNKLTFAENLKNSQFLNFSNIRDVISGLAVYSNNNFLSENTINDLAYSLPDINKVKIVFKELNGQERKFLFDDKKNIYLALEKNPGKFTVNDSIYVLPSYANHLMPKATLYGASALNLFFNEVDRYKNSGEKISVTRDVNVPFKQALAAAPKLAFLNSVDTIGQAKADVLIALNNSLSILPTYLASGLRSKFGLASPANTQINSELESRPAQDLPPEPPSNPPATTASTQTPKPPAPAPKPTPPAQTPVISETISTSNQQPVAESPSVPSAIQSAQPRPKPSFILAVGYTNPPAPSVEPAPIAHPLIEENPTRTLDILTTTFTPTSTIDITTSIATSTIEIATTTPLSGATSPTEEVATSTISVTTTIEISTTTPTSTIFVTTTLDTATTTTSTSIVDLIPQVAINEVAWAGTASTRPADEWFELYNNTDQDIYLDLASSTGWKIFVSGKQVKFTKINNSIISAHDYYLLERHEDSVIKDIGADAVYTLSGGFGNNGEKLELFKPNGEKIDEVDASADWFAGDNIKYRSMERINPTKNGSDPTNWQSNQGFRETGRTYNGGSIYGSPKRSNFGFISLNYSQDDDVRTLTTANNPYILQYYIIPAGKTLNIEPGVIIKSYYNTSKIDIYGALNAAGSGDKKIIFTSGRDTDFENNLSKIIVGIWPTTTPSAQDWQGFWFHPGSTGALDNINFRYAGHGFVVPPNALPVSQAIRAENSALAISNSSFSDNSLLNLLFKDSTTTISGSSFATGNQAIQSENSSLGIYNSSFNNFTNVNGPLTIKNRWPILENLTFLNNTLDMPYFGSVTIVEPQATIAETSNYLVLNLTVSASSTLNISPGANIYMPYRGEIFINGTLKAVGTADKPIGFSSYPSSTYWKNIKFSNSTSILDFVNLNHGNTSGSGLLGYNNEGAIVADNSNLIIRNSNLWDSKGFGNTVGATNSVLNIFNTQIGSSIKASNSVGVNARGGVLSLDNVNFNNLYVGVEAGGTGAPHPILEKKNMPDSNFINVDYPFEPSAWWNEASSTMP